MNGLVEKLNFTVNLDEAREFYKWLSKNFQDRKWTFSAQQEQLHPITVQKYDGYDYSGLPYGWALTSPYTQDDVASPWAITNFAPGSSKRETDMIQGFARKIFDKLPADAFEFSLTVHPPGSEIVKHSDGDNTMRVHIPLYNTTSFIIDANDEQEFLLEADGSAYLIDTRYQHRTINNTTTDRVSMLFGIPVSREEEVKMITGHLG
jgi:hypothetical protein